MLSIILDVGEVERQTYTALRYLILIKTLRDPKVLCNSHLQAAEFAMEFMQMVAPLFESNSTTGLVPVVSKDGIVNPELENWALFLKEQFIEGFKVANQMNQRQYPLTTFWPDQAMDWDRKLMRHALGLGVENPILSKRVMTIRPGFRCDWDPNNYTHAHLYMAPYHPTVSRNGREWSTMLTTNEQGEDSLTTGEHGLSSHQFGAQVEAFEKQSADREETAQASGQGPALDVLSDAPDASPEILASSVPLKVASPPFAPLQQEPILPPDVLEPASTSSDPKRKAENVDSAIHSHRLPRSL